MTMKEKLMVAVAATTLAANRPKVIVAVLLLSFPVLQCLDWFKAHALGLGYAAMACWQTPGTS